MQIKSSINWYSYLSNLSFQLKPDHVFHYLHPDSWLHLCHVLIPFRGRGVHQVSGPFHESFSFVPDLHLVVRLDPARGDLRFLADSGVAISFSCHSSEGRGSAEPTYVLSLKIYKLINPLITSLWYIHMFTIRSCFSSMCVMCTSRISQIFYRQVPGHTAEAESIYLYKNI